jgi:exodeoxyribonuclease VII small subunit
MSKEISYSDAIEELEEIVHEIENNDVSVDELGSKVSRAAMLIKLCKKKLFKTEEEVSTILKELDN